MKTNNKNIKKILVIGAFDFVGLDTGGQPVKTRELFWALQSQYGVENVDFFETIGWKSHIIKKGFSLFKKVRKNSVIIMLPAQNGVKVFSSLLLRLKRKKAKLYYDVIGGWLPEVLQDNPVIRTNLLKFDGIWVETTSMYNSLREEGFRNICVVNNFKHLSPIDFLHSYSSFEFPLKLCTFSRVMLEKGIEDAINAVRLINEEAREIVLTLDIYGMIDKNYCERFSSLQSNFPDYISYKGVVNPSDSVETISNYFALLFPTHFYTEGIPGTLIDACFAGVPVVSALWKNHENVFAEGITGWGFPFGNFDAFCDVLRRIVKEPQQFANMKESAVCEARKFTPEEVIKTIVAEIEGEK